MKQDNPKYEAILADIEANMPIRLIAIKNKCANGTVQTIKRDLGLVEAKTDKKADVIKLMAENKGPEEIAAILNSTVAYVRMVANNNGTPFINTERTSLKVIEMASTGLYTVKEISEKLGKTYACINQLIRKYDLKKLLKSTPDPLSIKMTVDNYIKRLQYERLSAFVKGVDADSENTKLVEAYEKAEKALNNLKQEL